MKMKKIWRNITATLALTSMAFPFWIDSKTETRNRTITNTINIFLVLLVAFAGDRVISHFLGQANLKSNFRYSRVYNTTGQADILLIGNSRGHVFYQPAIRELTQQSTLNLSYNALPVSIARALVEDYFDLYNAPKKIIVEVSMLNKTETNVINAFKVYQNHSQRIAGVISETSPKTSGACAISNLYSFNTEVFHRSLYYMKKNDDDWILTKKINAGLIEGSVNMEPIQFDVTKERFDNLRALIKRAKEHGTEVQLVVAPYYPNYRKNISNLSEFISAVEKQTGLKVRDYSGFITEDKYFSDYLHLNKNGSIEFMNKLKQDGVL
jgi:hypothetical protein